MATIRRAGFGTVFELEDSKVGIGTDAATHTLQALGNIRSEGVQDVGVTTLTTYQGFTNKEARFGQVTTDKSQQLGTLSGEIVIDGDVTVSSATTFTSGPQNLTVTDTFTLPSGDTNSRETKPTPGSLRFNQDFATLEFYTGNNWATVNAFTEMQNSPGNRGRSVHAGGANPLGGSFLPDMSHFEHATFGVGLAFGDLTVGGQGLGGFSSSTRGLFSGRRTPSTNPDNIIDYITIASTGDAIDFGDMTNQRRLGATLSSSTRGIMAGGITPSRVNIIDFVEMSTIGNATDFGDTTELFASMNGGGISNGTRGVYNSGESSSAVSRDIQFITISSKGNAVKFGELNVKRRACGMCSNSTRGLFAAGYNGGASTNRIEFITISSTGNGIDFGELARPSLTYTQGSASQTRGFFSGGYFSPAITASIDVISIAEGGNATDFGDLAFATESGAACSDSHGGLGGF